MENHGLALDINTSKHHVVGRRKLLVMEIAL